MFVSYLVPKHDAHLVVEDGLGFVAIGVTKEAAETAVREAHHKSQVEANLRAEAAGYEGDPVLSIEAEGEYVLHTNEV
jgi:hypothetical protein